MANRGVSQQCLNLIKKYEGCSLKAYWDVNDYSIGYGHHSVNGSVTKDMVITQAEADRLFAEDLKKYAAYVDNPSICWFTDQLNDNQRDALISFCYNCGCGSLQTCCKKRDINTCPDGMLLYNKVNGQVHQGLKRRREEEVALYKTPVKGQTAAKPVQQTHTATASNKSDEEIIWDYLYAKIGNAYGVAGLMGNLHAESGLRSNNLQNTFEKKFGMTDEQYTAAVDNGSYTNFVHDSAGYGLAQWTFWSRKEGLYNYIRSLGKSISDLNGQLDFLWQELSTKYKGVLDILRTATSVKQASDIVLTQFERPSDQSDAMKEKRAGYGQVFYDRYAGKSTGGSTPSTPEPAPGPSSSSKYKNPYPVPSSMYIHQNHARYDEIKWLQYALQYLGYYTMEVDGIWGPGTEKAVRDFQTKYTPDMVDGIVGPKTKAALLREVNK